MGIPATVLLTHVDFEVNIEVVDWDEGMRSRYSGSKFSTYNGGITVGFRKHSRPDFDRHCNEIIQRYQQRQLSVENWLRSNGIGPSDVQMVSKLVALLYEKSIMEELESRVSFGVVFLMKALESGQIEVSCLLAKLTKQGIPAKYLGQAWVLCAEYGHLEAL